MKMPPVSVKTAMTYCRLSTVLRFVSDAINLYTAFYGNMSDLDEIEAEYSHNPRKAT